jgi:tetratricopeptide (TPR) repeat protein
VPFGEASPQAKTRDELDAFGKVYDEAEPETVIRLARRFIEQYPQSEFLEFVNVPLLHAYEQIGESAKVKETALALLRLNPENIDALLALAAYRLEQPPGGGVQNEGLLSAREYAQHALERIRRFKAPVSADRTTWIRTKKALLAKSHMLLGIAAVQEKKLDEATDNLLRATEFDPQGDYFYRLALVYEATGRPQKALAAALRAQELGPEQVSRLAERKIMALRKLQPGPK